MVNGVLDVFQPTGTLRSVRTATPVKTSEKLTSRPFIKMYSLLFQPTSPCNLKSTHLVIPKTLLTTLLPNNK